MSVFVENIIELLIFYLKLLATTSYLSILFILFHENNFDQSLFNVIKICATHQNLCKNYLINKLLHLYLSLIA